MLENIFNSGLMMAMVNDEKMQAQGGCFATFEEDSGWMNIVVAIPNGSFNDVLKVRPLSSPVFCEFKIFEFV